MTSADASGEAAALRGVATRGIPDRGELHGKAGEKSHEIMTPKKQKFSSDF